MLCGPIAFGMCDFQLVILDLNFVKKSLIDKRFYFWETFDFWNLEILKLTFKIFETLKLWDFELKFELEIWNFEIWDFEN